jgi:flagellar basal body P-ring formation protein FlgA
MTDQTSDKKIFKTVLSTALVTLPLLAGVVSAAPTSTITSGVIEERAMEFVVDQIPWDPEATDVKIVYKGKDITVPQGIIDMNFDLPHRRVRMGRFPVAVKITVNNILQKKLRLTAHVTHYSPVIKTIRSVNRGEILTKGDVAIEVVPSNRILRNAMTSLDDVVGNQAIRNMGMGRVVTVNSLRKPTLVKKGDQVTLIAQNGGMKITAPGIVREKGFKDSLVQVLNIQTKKTVYGMVMDSKTVKVNF